MAPTAKKRSLHTKAPTAKGHKRQKLEQTARPPPSKFAKPLPAAERKKVRLDELQWKEVTLPDRLDDFEGFFGLEEIDDVEVTKDVATGNVSFETAKSEMDIAAKDVEQTGGDQEKEALEDGEDDEWEGFSDNDTPGGDAQKDAVEGAVEKPSILSKGDRKTLDKKAKKAGKGETGDIGGFQDPPISNGDVAINGKSKIKKNKKSDDLISSGKGAFDILADQPLDDDESEVDVSAWEELDLSVDTLNSLSKLKFSSPTPIQASAIPEILAGHDVVGKASTGSGKTLAFGIPILEAFLEASKTSSEQKSPLALIISPTRELAHQINAHLVALCTNGDFDPPLIATITGGLSVQKQRRQLEKADIIVGTPGRLWEVISSGQGVLSSLKKIRFLVVDEADRLLSQGHYKELGEILNVLEKDDEPAEDVESTEGFDAAPIQRQTLVFSATFHKGLSQKLAGKQHKGGDLMSKAESLEYLLKKLHFREEKPKFIDANPSSQMASRLKEGLVECAGTEKDLYLYALLLFHPKQRALVFCNSISAVRRLTPLLQNLDLPVFPLHSQMPQKARLRSVERFTERPGAILVATDVAARGLDIRNVQLIVHYHLPRAADTYVHRSGRTARAEASGSSILICAPEEVSGVRRLIAKVHARNHTSTKNLKKTAYFIRTLDIDRRIVSRLKPRATLAKTLADAVIAKEKKHSEDDWLKAAAEDLGVDYDSETFENEAPGRHGRGTGRKKKEKEARAMSKGEMQALRAELKDMLSQRVNVGVSEKYLTSGGIDVDALLEGQGNLEFLGNVDGLGFDD
ncbi:ATP-dependent RNA helicase MAK5 [Melanomma pulvis-pyrius CBS 109.77]|uniref:ATP-dependent RNA helicase n=1 Tax=Melanomma pulvis-pyrius CBS 109.77 TaxID=1314802 RepID=A0A6A6XT14_9PLEO|nr:ATP-dependent RNA helicase MAK5 [Melanomma pulvis-pyrius CBS 109.77]